MKSVLIVVGHSYSKQGLYNKELDISEYQYCLDIACELFKREEEDNIDLILKARNKSYRGLTEEINRLSPDYVIELHLNGFNEEVQGTEVLYAKPSVRGKRIAEVFQRNLVKNLQLKDRGIKSKKKGDRGSHILYRTKAPCVILEPFFLDSTKELYREEVIKSIQDSIREIVKI